MGPGDAPTTGDLKAWDDVNIRVPDVVERTTCCDVPVAVEPRPPAVRVSDALELSDILRRKEPILLVAAK